MTATMTPSNIAWAAAGKPANDYPNQVASDAPCATCGAITPSGISLKDIETPTTSGHADLFRFGTQHVCPACAWLFGAGKGRPGNYIAAGDRIEYTVISLDSVVEEKRPWIDVLRDVAALPPDTPIAAVMTTDVKPRLWHRVQPATRENFGLYLHVLDYDVSGFRRFSLDECLQIIETLIPMLSAGYAKASVFHSLLRDYARTSRNPEQAIRWEAHLATLRASPAFLPALIAAGVKKEPRNVR